MAYTDNQGMTQSRFWSIVIVVLIHAVLGYAFVTGLAINVAKKAIADLKTFDVKDEPPPPEEELPPPPPPNDLPPPPVVAPPPIVQTTTQAPVITTVATPPPIYIPPVAAPAPPPPPPKPVVASRAVQRSGSISDEDYPPAAQRNEESGTAVATFTVGTDGRVQSCNASGASASLDAETCKLIIRRFRYKPATDASGQPIAETKTQRVTWRLPK